MTTKPPVLVFVGSFARSNEEDLANGGDPWTARDSVISKLGQTRPIDVAKLEEALSEFTTKSKRAAREREKLTTLIENAKEFNRQLEALCKEVGKASFY